jgi:hypothetical protein
MNVWRMLSGGAGVAKPLWQARLRGKWRRAGQPDGLSPSRVVNAVTRAVPLPFLRQSSRQD